MKLTIITPATDESNYIDVALRSVPHDELDSIEHILVYDGNSAFIERLSENYPWLRIMSGKGRGATAAVAAAIAAASGDFIFFLNSDDCMLSGSIAAVVRAAKERPDVEVWTGGSRIFKDGPDGTRSTVRIIDTPPVTALNLGNVLDDLPLMTARFVGREVYERIGNLDEHFSACSDREFAIRMVLGGVREASLGVRVSDLRFHDESRTIRNTMRDVPAYLVEHLDIARRWMAEASLSPEMRLAFRDWHARETLRKCYYELRAGLITNAAQTASVAFSMDGFWPLRAHSIIPMLYLRRRIDLPV